MPEDNIHRLQVSLNQNLLFLIVNRITDLYSRSTWLTINNRCIYNIMNPLEMAPRKWCIQVLMRSTISSAALKVLQRGRKQQKTRAELPPLFLITVHRVCLCARCFYTRPKSERERGRDALVGCWLEGFRGKKRGGGLTETWREEGEFALCNTSTQPCLFSTVPPCPQPLTPLWLSFFFSKCKSPWKMCWSNICTEVVLGQADNLSVFEFGFPCSK